MNVAFSPQAGHVLLSHGSRKGVPSPPVGRNALRIAAQSVARPAGAGRSRVRVPPIRRMPHSGTHSVSEWESHQRSIAQWRERPPPKRKAAGSNPVGTTQGTRRVQTIRVCAVDSWTVATACDDTNRSGGWGRRRRMPIPPSQPMRVDPHRVRRMGWEHGSVAQHGRAPATVGRMRVRSPSEPLRVNVTHADPVHHLPDRRGSDGGEVCSSITAIDPPARTLFQPDARQRRPCRTFFDSFPGRRGSDGGGGGNINSPPEMPPACTQRPHWGRCLFSVQVRQDAIRRHDCKSDVMTYPP